MSGISWDTSTLISLLVSLRCSTYGQLCTISPSQSPKSHFSRLFFMMQDERGWKVRLFFSSLRGVGRISQAHDQYLIGILLRILWWKLNFMWSLCLWPAWVFPKELGNLTMVSASEIWVTREKKTRTDFVIGLLSPLNSFKNSRILRGRPYLCHT